MKICTAMIVLVAVATDAQPERSLRGASGIVPRSSRDERAYRKSLDKFMNFGEAEDKSTMDDPAVSNPAPTNKDIFDFGNIFKDDIPEEDNFSTFEDDVADSGTWEGLVSVEAEESALLDGSMSFGDDFSPSDAPGMFPDPFYIFAVCNFTDANLLTNITDGLFSYNDDPNHGNYTYDDDWLTNHADDTYNHTGWDYDWWNHTGSDIEFLDGSHTEEFYNETWLANHTWDFPFHNESWYHDHTWDFPFFNESVWFNHTDEFPFFNETELGFNETEWYNDDYVYEESFVLNDTQCQEWKVILQHLSSFASGP